MTPTETDADTPADVATLPLKEARAFSEILYKWRYFIASLLYWGTVTVALYTGQVDAATWSSNMQLSFGALLGGGVLKTGVDRATGK